MATLRDVANLAGVSTATVSLALNGRPVKAETRDAVFEAARKLNYVPNRIGQMLTSGRSNAIELVIMNSPEHPDIVRQTSLYYYLLEGVLSVADQNGMSVRFAAPSYDGPDLKRYLSELARDRLADGAIIVPQFRYGDQVCQILADLKFPFVSLQPEGYGVAAHCVDMGNYEGGCLVARFLLGLGARRVAVINGPANHIDAIERERGFVATLLEGGGDLVGLVNGAFTIESGFSAMKSLAERKLPDAIFCGNDYMAAGAMKYLRSQGVRVPHDVTIIGYDNSDVAKALDPELTTVDSHFFELGSELATSLLSILEAPGGASVRNMTPKLIARHSHLLSA
jgi:DNA-binding LacI/PurR family transcriptional regulator